MLITCDCYLPLAPPAGLKWWDPALHDDPGPHLTAVVRHTEDPELRRAERLPRDGGWVELGAMVDFYRDLTPPMPWSRTGMCWAERSHPVVAVRRAAAGRWEIDS